MKQADKRALEAYPIDSYEGHDDMYRQRGAFARGYKQAQQDFIEKACEWLKDNYPYYFETDIEKEFTDYDKTQVDDWIQKNVIDNLSIHNSGPQKVKVIIISNEEL